MATRDYTSRRFAIALALAEKLKQINGTGSYVTDIYSDAQVGLKFWDEIENFPCVYVVPGDEFRDYQGGGYKDRYLDLVVHCYVHDEFALQALEGLLEDVETVLEDNAVLQYIDRTGATKCTQDISVTNINTDEGVLDPLGVGQSTLQVRY